MHPANDNPDMRKTMDKYIKRPPLFPFCTRRTQTRAGGAPPPQPFVRTNSRPGIAPSDSRRRVAADISSGEPSRKCIRRCRSSIRTSQARRRTSVSTGSPQCGAMSRPAAIAERCSPGGTMAAAGNVPRTDAHGTYRAPYRSRSRPKVRRSCRPYPQGTPRAGRGARRGARREIRRKTGSAPPPHGRQPHPKTDRR